MIGATTSVVDAQETDEKPGSDEQGQVDIDAFRKVKKKKKKDTREEM